MSNGLPVTTDGRDIADLQAGLANDCEGSFGKAIGDVSVNDTQAIYFINARVTKAENR